MMRAIFVVVVVGIAGFAVLAQADSTVPIPAPAQNSAPSEGGPTPPPGAEEGGRYTLHRAGDAFVRLDTRTGQLSQCGTNAGIWSCTLVPDERTALEAEIARLQNENAALKRSLLARGLDLPSGNTAEARTPRADAPVPPMDVPDATPRPPKGPSEPDFDRAITYMKNVWRKLVDMMLDLQRDVQRKI